METPQQPQTNTVQGVLPEDMKHIILCEFESSKYMEKLKKQYGEVANVNLFMTEKDDSSITVCNFSKVVAGKEVKHQESSPMTPEQKQGIYNILQVNDEVRAETESIFIKLDYIKRSITIQQNKKDKTTFKVKL